MNAFLIWLESTPLHNWIVESPSLLAFPGILALHAIGMGFAAGLGAAIDLRILGIAPGIPLREMRRLLPILWTGFWLNAASGVLLLIGYPTKALTNPVFYLKLGLIAIAMVLVARIGRRLESDDDGGPDKARPTTATLRRMAMVSLACWAGAVTSGRLLAYTYRHLFATENISALLHPGRLWSGGLW